MKFKDSFNYVISPMKLSISSSFLIKTISEKALVSFLLSPFFASRAKKSKSCAFANSGVPLPKLGTEILIFFGVIFAN